MQFLIFLPLSVFDLTSRYAQIRSQRLNYKRKNQSNQYYPQQLTQHNTQFQSHKLVKSFEKKINSKFR